MFTGRQWKKKEFIFPFLSPFHTHVMEIRIRRVRGIWLNMKKIGSLCCVSSSERKQGDRRTQCLRIGERLENWPGKIRSTSIWCDKLTFIQFLQIFFQLSGQKLVKQRGLDPVNPVYFIQFYSYKLKIQFNLDVRRCYKTMFEIRLNGEILMTRGWQRMQ